MRGEIIKLHKKLGSTTIYVTHDQIEAMTMASRIVVMKDGYIQQVGTPKDIYDNPANAFVAGFIGTPPMNFVNGVVNEEGHFITKDNECDIILPEDKFEVIKKHHLIHKEIILGIRPEHISDKEEKINELPNSTIEVTVDVAELLGASTNIYATVSGYNVCAVVDPRIDLKIGDKVKLGLDLSKCHIFDAESEVCLTSKFYMYQEETSEEVKEETTIKE